MAHARDAPGDARSLLARADECVQLATEAKQLAVLKRDSYPHKLNNDLARVFDGLERTAQECLDLKQAMQKKLGRVAGGSPLAAMKESAFGTSLHTSHNELQQKMCSIQTWLYMLGGYEQDGDRRHEAQRQIQKTIMLRAAMQVIVFVCQDVGMDALDLQSLSSLQISSPPSLDHQIGQLTLHTSDQQDQPEDGISLSRVQTVPNTPIDSPLEGSNTNQDQQVTVYVPDSASITKALILTIQKDEIGRDHLDNILEGVSEVHCSERCVLSNGESTLIHEAVSSGKPEYLSSLLEHDSHCKQELIDKFDKDRYTPLILAACQAKPSAATSARR